MARSRRDEPADRTPPKTTAKKTAAASSAAPKKVAGKKTLAKKTAAKQNVAKQNVAKQTVAKKAAAKKAAAKKAAAKKAAAKKAAAKKAAAKTRPGARPGRLRETASARRERAAEIVRRLHAEYPDARCSLDHRNAYELLTATILSAQCTDERVNMVTPALFRRYPAPADLAAAPQEDVEEMIRSTGFFRNKARSLLGMATAVTEHHDGEVPASMAALVALPGVGRKTANVVLGNAFGMSEGVVVDTHVKRLSGRLGLTTHTDPEKIEPDLMRVVDRSEWTDVSHLFIYHGRAVCRAPTPRCEACVLAELCPSSRV